MKGTKQFQRTALVAILASVLFVAGALAAGPPTATITLTPASAAPGTAITAKAVVKINDGSTLQSVAWKQTDGPAFTFTGGTTDTIAGTLPDRKTFRSHLVDVLEEPPVKASVLPKYVPLSATWENGLQDRYAVAGVSNHALSDAANLTFELTVVTSSGTYKVPATFAAALPWETATGNPNVAINLPVIVHGKTQASYNWALTAPDGSKTTLVDPTTQNPEFTPDVPGVYKLTVTDLSKNSTTTLNVYAGRWKGVITGQNAAGRPTVDQQCLTCHVGATEMFTPWSKSGHAEILTQNVTTPGPGHYGEACFECHTVGYVATPVNNGGVKDQADFTKAADIAHTTADKPGDPLAWTNILKDAPASARLMNIQCENCHGPQDSQAHTKVAPRVSLSSDMCGSCHGEPARHGRFQQWQLSGHSNFETAVGEGTNPSCAKCHSAQGFLQWADNGFSTAAIKVSWTADEVQPQTCVVCHDPHAEGTTSGDANTNATVRSADTTPMLDAGFVASGVGKAALCMDCHNGRRGLKDDQHASTNLAQAPHVGPQADVLMGQNLYLTKVGTKGFHAMIPDSCVTCHMNKTNPPSTLANKNADGTYGGTNHTFYASTDICKSCHTSITAESVQGPVMAKMATLKSNMETALKGTMQAQIRSGNVIDIGGTKVKYANDIKSVSYVESHGAQAIGVTLANGTTIADTALGSVKVVRPSGSSIDLFAAADPALYKAGWNYFMVNSDSSKGVHNPAFVNSALDVSIFATNAYNAAIAAPAVGGGAASIGGGLGNGAGAVSCTTPYVYWAEIAGHMPGNAGSNWRTDVIARNLGSKDATLKFFLHQADGTNLTGGGTVVASGQKAFEDIVANAFNVGNNLGSLEICSDQPLLVAGRIFNQAQNGTFGQNLDGKVADLGYTAGQTVNLIGLRQRVDQYRTNISVTNGGTTEAQVSVSLFDATGLPIKTYTLTVPAGTVLQDNEPFKNRANTPDIDWGYATVTVLKGTNVMTSASMIDARTNDPTTIMAKQ